MSLPSPTDCGAKVIAVVIYFLVIKLEKTRSETNHARLAYLFNVTVSDLEGLTADIFV